MKNSSYENGRTKEALHAKITAEFPRESWPKSLTQPDAYDRSAIERDFKRYKEGLRTDQVIFDQRGALSALSPSGFAFVLPFYLEYLIRNPASDVTEKLAHFLLYAPSSSRAFVAERLNQLSPTQRGTLAEVLGHVADRIEKDEPVLATVVREAEQVVRSHPR